MAVKDNKTFAVASTGLESLADGIKKHSQDPDFPKNLSEADVRTERQSLENSRQTFVASRALADQAGKGFLDHVKKAKTVRSAARRILEGVYGLYSKKLEDFGYTPRKPGGRKGPRNTAKTSSKETDAKKDAGEASAKP